MTKANVWRHVICSQPDNEGKTTVTCRHCGKSAQWSATRAGEHLAQCGKFKASDLESWRSVCSSIPPASMAKNATLRTIVNDARRPLTSIARPVIAASTGALAEEVGSAPTATVAAQTLFMGFDSMSEVKVEELRLEVARFFFEENIPFNKVGSDGFVRMIRTLRPAFPVHRLPSRQCLSSINKGSLMRLVHDDLMEQVDAIIDQSSSRTISIDGWDDVCKNALHNVTITDSVGRSFLVGVVDDPQERSTAQRIFDHLKPFIERYKPNAITTDSPSAMMTMRELVREKYPGTVTMSCLFHAVDLVARRVLDKNNFFESALASASGMVQQFKVRKNLRGVLRHLREEANAGDSQGIPTLKLAGGTRKLSMLNTFVSVLRNETLMRETLMKPNVRSSAQPYVPHASDSLTTVDGFLTTTSSSLSHRMCARVHFDPKIQEYMRGLPPKERSAMAKVFEPLFSIDNIAFKNFGIVSLLLKPLASLARAFESTALNLSDAVHAFEWTRQAYQWMQGDHDGTRHGGAFTEDHVSEELSRAAATGVFKRSKDAREALKKLIESIDEIRTKYVPEQASLACLVDPRRNFSRDVPGIFKLGKELLDRRIEAIVDKEQRKAAISEWRQVANGSAFREEQISRANLMPADDWWRAEAQHLPQLSKIAVAVLGMTFTASPVERVNSMSAYVKDKSRNRLSIERAAMQTKIYVNSRAVKLCGALDQRSDFSLGFTFKKYATNSDPALGIDDDSDDDEGDDAEDDEEGDDAEDDEEGEVGGAGGSVAEAGALKRSPPATDQETHDMPSKRKKKLTCKMIRSKQQTGNRKKILSSDIENFEFECYGRNCGGEAAGLKSKFVLASFKKEVVGEDGKVSFRWTAMHNCFNCKMPYHGFVCSGCEDCCGSDICHQLHLERDEGEQGE